MSRELLNLRKKLVTTTGLHVAVVDTRELAGPFALTVCIIEPEVAEYSRIVNIDNFGAVYTLDGRLIQNFKVINLKKKLWINVYRHKPSNMLSAQAHEEESFAVRAESLDNLSIETVVLAREIEVDHDV